jgi:hypothetical protein
MRALDKHVRNRLCDLSALRDGATCAEATAMDHDMDHLDWTIWNLIRPDSIETDDSLQVLLSLLSDFVPSDQPQEEIPIAVASQLSRDPQAS